MNFLKYYDPKEKQLIRAVKEDDIVTLEKCLQIYPIDHKASKFITFPDSILKHSPSILALSAFYKSIKVFRYLIINNADTNNTDDINAPMTHFAVAGGEMEIISVLDQMDLDFDGSIYIAAERGMRIFSMDLFQSPM